MLPLVSLFLLKLLLLLGQASVCTLDQLFVRLPSLCLDVCFLCTRLSTHLSAVHSVAIVKLLLKLRNVLKRTERQSCFAFNQISNKTCPQRWRFFYALKRNETKRHKHDSPRKNPRNTRVISAEELDTMSKNNLRGITLVRGPIWGIHSLTLIISWIPHNRSNNQKLLWET